MNLATALICAQGVVGIAIVGGTAVLVSMAIDKHSPWLHKVTLTGLGIWGMWFTWLAFNDQPDSPPAIAFGTCLAYVLLRYGKQLSHFLDGEPWVIKTRGSTEKVFDAS